MKKFYGFLYIHDGIIAFIISFIISLLIAASLIAVALLLRINYSGFDAYIISFLITTIFLVSLLFIGAYLSDVICDYSYLKIYEDEKFYQQVWLKKQKRL